MKILTNWLRSAVPGIRVDDHQLAEDLTLRGIAVEGVHDLGPGNGHLFEMDITTNRVDAMNHYGIAREAATIYNLPLVPFETALPVARPAAAEFGVEIEARGLCGRFTAQVLRDVTIAPSSGLVSEYFALLGLKQISNAVDASNFVLQWMGHPTHAFDLDKIEGGIIVRLARKGERLKLLDGTERTLEDDDLVVADHVKALGLAGVMGGWESMITPATKNILVEAAWFDPACVRRSARRHGFHTDASHRFERGADFNACATANALVSKLILGAGGVPEGELVDVIVPELAARTADRPPIAISLQQVQRHLGSTLETGADAANGITAELLVRYLTALGCALTPQVAESGTFAAKLPSWRLDIEREIDLVEEIARVYGYNRFANTLPTGLPVVAHPLAASEAAVRERLLALGYSEAISSSFASDADSQTFIAGSQLSPIPMENPLSDEARLLRPSLVPGMVTMLAHNLNRDVREVRLFEQGTVYSGTADDAGVVAEVLEAQSLSLGLTGSVPTSGLYSANDAPIFELKGVVESLLSLFAASPETLSVSAAGQAAFVPQAPMWLEPGRSATALLNGVAVACFGELIQGQREVRKLRQPVYLAEIDLAALYRLPLGRSTARELSRFQAVERDFSFIFPDSVQWRVVAEAIEALAIPALKSLSPVEVFRGGASQSARGVSSGHFALLIRCVLQSNDRTLREDEITAWSANIMATLTELGGVVRA
jgi:phenylalanyl-tRNA synthetase beta chain